eukprot:CAMPEP_0113717736 /NCGR_PEP_ID=MMETSP0038_2-20120614/34744_1 /TAXON_ID=2898 /ORGANISM="Cryptomonas paramecium" /LENGTH=137 /DNA_ID=CAMNT_0000645669 /DNA_START=187 /DNA_END=597 /DNA_ORIENTATION=+ /assembly_acc=CAM_ASM_000170
MSNSSTEALLPMSVVIEGHIPSASVLNAAVAIDRTIEILRAQIPCIFAGNNSVKKSLFDEKIYLEGVPLGGRLANCRQSYMKVLDDIQRACNASSLFLSVRVIDLELQIDSSNSNSMILNEEWLNSPKLLNCQLTLQ